MQVYIDGKYYEKDNAKASVFDQVFSTAMEFSKESGFILDKYISTQTYTKIVKN